MTTCSCCNRVVPTGLVRHESRDERDDGRDARRSAPSIDVTACPERHGHRETLRRDRRAGGARPVDRRRRSRRVDGRERCGQVDLRQDPERRAASGRRHADATRRTLSAGVAARGQAARRRDRAPVGGRRRRADAVDRRQPAARPAVRPGLAMARAAGRTARRGAIARRAGRARSRPGRTARLAVAGRPAARHPGACAGRAAIVADSRRADRQPVGGGGRAAVRAGGRVAPRRRRHPAGVASARRFAPHRRSRGDRSRRADRRRSGRADRFRRGCGNDDRPAFAAYA